MLQKEVGHYVLKFKTKNTDTVQKCFKIKKIPSLYITIKVIN